MSKKHQTLSDSNIISLYWDRNETAIKETDVKYGAYIHRVAWNILYDIYDCEECKNDTYLGMWKAIPPDRPTALKAYITKIARCTAINMYKKKSRGKRIPSELTVAISECEFLLEDSYTPHDELEAHELGRIISDYVRTLPEKQQLAFICRYYFADSVKSIARYLGVTTSSVFKYLASARAGLLEHLRDAGVEP